MRDAAALPPLNFTAPICLIGGAAFDDGAFDLAAGRAGPIVAADGGVNAFAPGRRFADHAGRVAAVVGDMDSVEDLALWRDRAEVDVRHIAGQDSTDLEKALRAVDAPLVLGLGFLGARFDHTLAATHVLLRFPQRRVILIGEEDLIFLSPLDWRARLAPGARVSVFPLRPVRAQRSAGLRWPLDGLELASGDQIGTSNEAVAAEVSASFETRSAAVILDRAHLDAAIASLTEAAL